MIRCRLLAGVLAALLVAARPAPPYLTLARAGHSTYRIVIAPDGSPSERHAAEEFQRFMGEMSGATLPIVTDASPDGDLILVGRSRALDRLAVGIGFESLGPEDFVLKTAGRHLVVAGGRQRGTLYGVYTLLDRLGCRWFTRDVSRIPKRPTLRVAPLDEVGKPAFEYREPFFTEAFERDWAARNRVNGAHMELDASTGGRVAYYPFVHTFYELLPPEKHFASHPEYYSWINGGRRAERGQLCLTNPDVLRLSTETVLGWIDAHPEATLYSVSQNDWEGWCECDRCRAVEAEEGGAHSAPILRFVNALAEEVEKKHPDKLIDTLAYWYSEAPPLQARPRPNVRIRLCPINACEAHPYEQCPYNAEFMRNLKGWAAATSQLYIWHYVTNFSHYLLPFPDFDELAADIPMYRRNGVVGMFLEGAYPAGGGGENAELRSYVMARLLWDPGTDVRGAIREFMEGVYGRAARPMLGWFDLLHAEVRLPPRGAGQHIWIRRSPELSERVLRRGRDLFRQAEAAAEDAAARSRIEKARLSLDYYELLGAKTRVSREGRYAPAGLSTLEARFRTFAAALSRLGITSIHEGVPLADDGREIADALRPLEVITLENGRLRVEVVPELGRVIRLIEAPSGLDALRPPDRGGHAPGLTLALYPDARSRSSMEISWRLDSRTGPREIVLAGAAATGLHVTRRLRLGDGPVLETRAAVENVGPAPVRVALQSRFELNPGTTGDADVLLAFSSRAGAKLEKQLLGRGLYTGGSEWYERESAPADAWQLRNRVTGLVVTCGLAPGQVERSFASWRPRGENRASMADWSPEVVLAPGQRTELHLDYALRRGQ